MDPAVTVARVAIRATARYTPLLEDYYRSLDAIAVDPFDVHGHDIVALTCLAAWDDPELAALVDQIEGYDDDVRN